MTSNSVTGINVVSDYVTGISWSGTHEEHFKAFSGSQLTAAQVGAWSVVPTFAGAGQQSALSFGDCLPRTSGGRLPSDRVGLESIP